MIFPFLEGQQDLRQHFFACIFLVTQLSGSALRKHTSAIYSCNKAILVKEQDTF